MKDKYLIIREAGNVLTNGQSIRIDCPFCNHNDKSLSITRKIAHILYHCFHASCGRSGVLGGKISLNKADTKFTPKIFKGNTEPMPVNIVTEYLSKYNISNVDIKLQGILWDSTDQRLVFPLYTEVGHKWGTLTKAITNGVKPKTILYKYEDIIALHFPIQKLTDETTIVLVEDVISAIVVSKVAPCAAILGTHLREKVVLALRRMGFARIILMLDPDATAKAIGQAKTFAGLMNFSVIPLSKGDPKDHSTDEIWNLLRGNNAIKLN